MGWCALHTFSPLHFLSRLLLWRILSRLHLSWEYVASETSTPESWSPTSAKSWVERHNSKTKTPKPRRVEALFLKLYYTVFNLLPAIPLRNLQKANSLFEAGFILSYPDPTAAFCTYRAPYPTLSKSEFDFWSRMPPICFYHRVPGSTLTHDGSGKLLIAPTM